jgi:ADP-heptose:LPS heptosyltransferase
MNCFGVRFDIRDLKLEYPLSAEDREFAVRQLGPRCSEPKLGVIMSGSNPDKFWGVANISVLIDGLNMRRPDIDIILFTTKNYYESARKIVKNKLARVAAPTDSLHEFASMLSVCEFILTPDTSAVHFAAAFNIPCLVLFSLDPNSKRMPWYPFNSRHEVLVEEGPIDRINAMRVEAKLNILLQDYRRPE